MLQRRRHVHPQLVLCRAAAAAAARREEGGDWRRTKNGTAVCGLPGPHIKLLRGDVRRRRPHKRCTEDETMETAGSEGEK